MNLNTMIKFKTIQERMYTHQGYDEYLKLVAQAYMKAPENDPSAAPYWKAMIAEDAKLYKQLLSNIKVEVVNGEPYADYQDIRKDVKENHHLFVSNGYLEHPVMTHKEHIVNRAVHDYYEHVLGNHPFGAKGEIEAYNLALRLYSKNAAPALFTEIIGQSSVVVTTGKFPVKKVALLHGFDYFNVGKLSTG